MTPDRLLAVLLAGLVLTASHCTAKPPDLPLDLSVRCEEPGAAATAVDAPECFPCPDACLAVSGCLGWSLQALLGQCPADAEQLTVMPKVVRRMKAVAPQPSQEEQDARDLEELQRRSHQLRLQSQASRTATKNQQKQEEVWRERMARQLYRIAEGCRRAGDHEMAYSCYCEVELLVPNSPLGERAREQMAECQRHLSDAEEAETPEDPMDSTPGDKFEIE